MSKDILHVPMPGSIDLHSLGRETIHLFKSNGSISNYTSHHPATGGTEINGEIYGVGHGRFKIESGQWSVVSLVTNQRD
jgi:hypothetical protein